MTDVLVQGAGAVGSSLALALSRQGLDVVLARDVARPAGAAPDIRAYALNAASLALLRELKVWDDLPADAVTPVHDMQIDGDAVGATLRFSAWTLSVPALAWIVDAAALEASLDAALRFAPHVRALDAAQADAQKPVATLVAHCEGKASSAHEDLGVAFDRHDYEQSALATRVVSMRPHGATARQWFRSPDVLALLPLDRPEPAHSCAVVWSLPRQRALALAALADAEFETALNDATRHLGEGADAALGALRLAGPRATWPLLQARAQRVSGEAWVLLGDAAHVVHPLAGQGLNLGLADVATLAGVIASREPWRGLGDARLLARYARRRATATATMLGLTDGLLRIFSAQAPFAKELRNRGLTLVDHLPLAKRWLAARAFGA